MKETADLDDDWCCVDGLAASHQAGVPPGRRWVAESVDQAIQTGGRPRGCPRADGEEGPDGRPLPGYVRQSALREDADAKRLRTRCLPVVAVL